MMFFVLFVMISPVRSTRFITWLLPRKDGYKSLKNSNDAVNNSWEIESSAKSLDNVKLMDNFVNIFDNLFIMAKEYQQYFEEGCRQPFPYIKKTLCNSENSTILRNRLVQNNKHLKPKLNVICKQDELLYKEVYDELKRYFSLLRFSDESMVAKQKNVQKSVNRYRKIHYILARISCHVNTLVHFMSSYISIEENPGRWLNDIITNANLLHTYFHKIIFRYHEAFFNNKLCPFGKDSLKKLDRIQNDLNRTAKIKRNIEQV